MPPLTLPEPIAAYFAADTQSPESLARCFMPGATVQDVGQTHTGHEAIKAWKANASTKYGYTNEPLAIEPRAGVHRVRSRVSGNFPGSPVELNYLFRLENGLIAHLEVTA